MKILLRFSAVMLCLGMLGASACSSCMQQPTSQSSLTQQPSMVCGAGTHRVGNQCIGDSVKK